jgi:interferon gamma inducible protein 47
LQENKYNIGFCGQVNSGKSRMMNALRGYKIADEKNADYAKIGNVETTKHIRQYSHPGNDHVEFWDIPGAGTTSFGTTSNNYFM